MLTISKMRNNLINIEGNSSISEQNLNLILNNYKDILLPKKKYTNEDLATEIKNKFNSNNFIVEYHCNLLMLI